jgi:hypothetical protein
MLYQLSYSRLFSEPLRSIRWTMIGQRVLGGENSAQGLRQAALALNLLLTYP